MDIKIAHSHGYEGIVISPAHTSTAAMIGVTICIYRSSRCLQQYNMKIQKHSPTAKVKAKDIDSGVAVGADTYIAESASAATTVVPAANRRTNAT